MQHRYSTHFAAMLQNKLHVFCCPLFGTLREFFFNNVWYNFLLLQLSDGEGAWLFCSVLWSHAGLGKCRKDWQT